MRIRLFVFFCFSTALCFSQSPQSTLIKLTQQQSEIESNLVSIEKQIEETKLKIIRGELQDFVIPAIESDEQLTVHSAIALSYSEKHEQARWVAHVITPDIITGRGYRTNDFRPDTTIATGSAIEKDYFLKYPKGDGGYEYDGYGYDRGHLAPSADFRWSEKALSESYLYSNMSPQLPEFNREIWAELENGIRNYIYRNPTSTLYVVTGGVLTDDLKVVERSINKVSVPEQYFKVVIDRVNQKGIGFILPYNTSETSLELFAFTIDEIEEKTGLDFYHGLSDEEENALESQLEKSVWLPGFQEGNVESLTLETVPRKRAYPATFGTKFMNKDTKVNICGTVVGGRYSRNGNLLLNIDKQFPNQIFTVFIKKENLVNFSYDPIDLIGSQICTKGKVQSIGGTPTMYLSDENKLEVIKDSK